MADIINLRPRPSEAAKRAELWEGLVRMMEANGRTKLEIDIAEVREIAALARSAARG